VVRAPACHGTENRQVKEELLHRQIKEQSIYLSWRGEAGKQSSQDGRAYQGRAAGKTERKNGMHKPNRDQFSAEPVDALLQVCILIGPIKTTRN